MTFKMNIHRERYAHTFTKEICFGRLGTTLQKILIIKKKMPRESSATKVPFEYLHLTPGFSGSLKSLLYGLSTPRGGGGDSHIEVTGMLFVKPSLPPRRRS